MKVSDLRENPYNANTLTPETYEKIRDSVLKEGFLDPYIYHCSDGQILSGTHRVKISKELGRESDLILVDIGNPGPKERIRLTELYNTRGESNQLKRAIVWWSYLKDKLPPKLETESVSQWISRTGGQGHREIEELAKSLQYRPTMVARYVELGRKAFLDHPWFIREVDGHSVTYLHAYYLLNMDHTRRIYSGGMDKSEREVVMRKVLVWLREEYQKTWKPVSNDVLQAKLRAILKQDLGKILPELCDVPWASFWYPEKRIESIRHIIEEGCQLGTYKDSLRKSVGRLTRISSFSMSIAFNLIRLLTRRITIIPQGEEQEFKRSVIVDPFMGMGIRVVTARYLNHEAYGYDISIPTYKKVADLWSEYQDSFFVGDARVLPHADDSVDIVFTSPPYWNMEKYEGSEKTGQLSKIESYEIFFGELKKALNEMERIVKPGGYIALVVGNFREGKYYAFPEEVEFHMLSLGLDYWDKIILAHDITRPMGGIASLKKNHTRVCHEEMLIFKKPGGLKVL